MASEKPYELFPLKVFIIKGTGKGEYEEGKEYTRNGSNAKIAIETGHATFVGEKKVMNIEGNKNVKVSKVK